MHLDVTALQLVVGTVAYGVSQIAAGRLEELRVRAGATQRSRRRAIRARLLVAAGVSVILALLAPTILVGDVLLALGVGCLVAALLVRVPDVRERIRL